MDRQKKLLIFGLAWVSAGLLTWFLYARTVAPRQEQLLPVTVAARDMALGTLLGANDLKQVRYKASDVPRGALGASKDAVGRVLLVPVAGNEPVLAGKLSGATSVEGVSSTIDRGYRAVSVSITDASGVAGLVLPNSRVDVLFTRPGTLAEAATSTILEDVKVLSTGRAIPAGQTVDPRAPRAQVVTLLLKPFDAQKLELAKNQGKIGLSLRNPTDTSRAEDSGPMTTDVLDPDINTRVAAARQRARTGAGGRAPEEQQDWQRLAALAAQKQKQQEEAAKEAEKPRATVDVFRGDKHVQEQFK
jgi:pilus assembly protein CpaB